MSSLVVGLYYFMVFMKDSFMIFVLVKSVAVRDSLGDVVFVFL